MPLAESSLVPVRRGPRLQRVLPFFSMGNHPPPPPVPPGSGGVSGPSGINGGGSIPPAGGRGNRLFKQALLAAFWPACRAAFPNVEIADEIKAGIKVENPKDASHGEFSIPVFTLARLYRQAPAKIAAAISVELAKNPEIGQFFDLSVVNGYINFKFSDAFLLQGVAGLDASFGRNDTLAGKRYLVEYVSANPTGPLHIGHGRWAVLGDSICRLLEACGAVVEREFYINDAGAQIDRFRASVNAAKQGTAIPEDGYHGAYIQE